ncbi:MAG: FAD-dependent oxidoreductase, partial [Betaproteobacteria bacterium]
MTGPASAPRNPVILTVDDDPAVSRAVARDLRKHYGERYRIVRAESGQDALVAINELQLRGDTVAMFIADYQMPEMNGIDFLELAMDVFPLARRVLLTAYADTHAAINAINLVDLDHYLLKPWDPPEEKLYPIIDGLLEAWHEVGDRAVPHTKVIGHRWNPRSWEVRQFLARNQHYYRAYSSDEAKGKQLLTAAGLDGLELPVVISEQGETLVQPTDAQLAGMLGLATTPSLEMYDLAVIGGGPAGLAAAVYGASEGLRTVLIERTTTGGQAGRSSRIENYLGFETGISGAELTTSARRQAERFAAEVITTREVVGLDVSALASKTLTFDDGRSITARSVILATGVDYRHLQVSGCWDNPDEVGNSYVGNGVFYGASVSQASECAGEDVYIVGGANSAGQSALNFARYARKVTILIRADSLAKGMSRYLIDLIEAADNIEVLTGTQLAEAHGNERLESLTLARHGEMSAEPVAADAVYIFIGAEPHTEEFREALTTDDRGFLVTGPDLGGRPVDWPLDRDPYPLESCMPGVFVAGDVRLGSIKRVASAVGEGAMAVQLIHRFL